MLGFFDQLLIQLLGQFGCCVFFCLVCFPKNQDFKKTLKTPFLFFFKMALVSYQAAHVIARNDIDGAAALLHHLTNIAEVVEAMGAEFGTLRKVANQA